MQSQCLLKNKAELKAKLRRGLAEWQSPSKWPSCDRDKVKKRRPNLASMSQYKQVCYDNITLLTSTNQ